MNGMDVKLSLVSTRRKEMGHIEIHSTPVSVPMNFQNTLALYLRISPVSIIS